MILYGCSRCYWRKEMGIYIFFFLKKPLTSVGFIAEAKGNAPVNLLCEHHWREGSEFPE